LVPLIKKVTNAKQIKEDFLHQSFPVEEQKKFMELMQIYCRLHLQTDLLKGKG
jgi:possible carboxypeptidase taq